MLYKTTFYVLLILFFVGPACNGDEPAVVDAAATRQWLFVRNGPGLGPLEHGDVITQQGEELRLRNVVTGRDTLVRQRSVASTLTVLPDGNLELQGTANGASLLSIEAPDQPLDTAFLTRQPFAYDMGGADYWASFEPVYTGFPEFTRPGALDFVNRRTDWTAAAPGLEYSEYRLVNGYGQPILLVAERERGRYVNTLGVLIDTVAADGFGGRVFHDASADLPTDIYFRALPQPPAGYTAESFTALVNRGYSRSYLLGKPARPRPVGEDKRLPRKSLIDPSDLGRISASFLEDGSVMFLSDDHIILQGSYVLDLDKGLLTISDPDGASFRIFVDTQDGVEFTLPVTVVELQGGQLVGQDNYLRIEVVE